jgi:hypothetical protein
LAATHTQEILGEPGHKFFHNLCPIVLHFLIFPATNTDAQRFFFDCLSGQGRDSMTPWLFIGQPQENSNFIGREAWRGGTVEQFQTAKKLHRIIGRACAPLIQRISRYA